MYLDIFNRHGVAGAVLQSPRVTCLSFFYLKKLIKFTIKNGKGVELVGGGSVINGAYPV